MLRFTMYAFGPIPDSAEAHRLADEFRAERLHRKLDELASGGISHRHRFRKPSDPQAIYRWSGTRYAILCWSLCRAG